MEEEDAGMDGQDDDDYAGGDAVHPSGIRPELQ